MINNGFNFHNHNNVKHSDFNKVFANLTYLMNNKYFGHWPF